ncbi:hypothetical protein LINGRAHAP2_LOCUS6986 [Linum grandiflorum]
MKHQRNSGTTAKSFMVKEKNTLIMAADTQINRGRQPFLKMETHKLHLLGKRFLFAFIARRLTMDRLLNRLEGSKTDFSTCTLETEKKVVN